MKVTHSAAYMCLTAGDPDLELHVSAGVSWLIYMYMYLLALLVFLPSVIFFTQNKGVGWDGGSHLQMVTAS